MTRRLKEHPDYPFSDGNLEATVLEMESFLAEPALTAVERGEVLEFIRLTRQYAFLERLIQGDILFELPVHLDLTDATVEHLANQERELSGLGSVPAEELIDCLDERGIKVFRRSRGPESPEILTGAFCYVGEFGPALLAGAAGRCEAVFVVAHAYGHLVMDINPYRSRFCRWRRSDLENMSDSAEERRADHFARALLLPDPLVKALVADLTREGSDNALEAMVPRAAEVCDVPPAVLWRRLGDLGLPCPEAKPVPGPIPVKRKVDERRATDLPERFVNLALAAFGERLLARTELARFLRIPPERLAEFLRWCPIPRVRRMADEADEEEAQAEEDSE